MDTSPEAVARRARIEKWFWVLNFGICLGLFVWAYGIKADPQGIFLMYLALVSVHALVKTCATEEQAAESRMSEDAQQEDA